MKRYYIVLFILMFSKTSYAVCVKGYPSISEEYRKSLYVFIGQVVSVSRVPASEEYYDGHNYTLNVHEVLKGDLAESIIIFSENSSGRFPMKKGGTYIFFVYKELGRLQVSNCGNSGLLSEKNDVVNVVRGLIENKN